MKAAPAPADEIERLAALSDAAILDTPPERAFDDLTRLAASICRTPIALVSLVDRERQWFKSKVGLDASETPREVAFCAHAILGDELFLVPDAYDDERFADNPLVTGAPNVRFYAGAPLATADGHNIGTLCVIDNGPRQLDDDQRSALSALARQVAAQIDLRRANGRLAKLNGELVARAREAQAVIEQRKVIERIKDEFVSTVAHELRTPLTSIRGALGLLEGGVLGALPDEAMEVVNIARTNTDRLVRLINDFLDLEKIEAGKLELTPKHVDVRRLVSSLVESLSPVAAEAKVELWAEVRGDLDLVADEDRIAQVLTNLMSNALKFSPSEARVELFAEATATGHVRFGVRDRGPGIAEADLARLFNRFEQLGGHGPRKVGGTGLGLAISKAIVEQHGGTIGVASTLGQGSTFWFELPPRDTRPSLTAPSEM
ncbi:sensor histidine kinase [Polyangium jinanense]|uniref:histidine kinase n=1 Tax=Polyangium jinanense TaxID=2829994 RepID=A0A9X4AUX9_9BACT|nr:GAF domain-containing sensor histidine kinase [Polyangium jinanense]MDC3959309.1 GAF domain-containing sensor histidine kinase [Polyangium jinanense]MDC3985718.1 GAF domain-containing sensor histidine kinase [Polyangium jinanense]